MFNFSGSEVVFLLLIALIVLGPEKLPEAVRKFGKTYAEFKKMTTGFQSELKSALDEPMREMRETADAFKKAASFDFDSEPDKPEIKPEAEIKPEPETAATDQPTEVAPSDDVPVPTGLDAVVVRDAPVQQIKPAAPEVPSPPAPAPEPPSIAGPVVTRTPRKNTAASFRRAPKTDDVPQQRADGSAPPLAPRADPDDEGGTAAG